MLSGALVAAVLKKLLGVSRLHEENSGIKLLSLFVDFLFSL
jgi:hypothetical protein